MDKRLTDEERALILAELDGDTEARVAMLKELAEFPTGDGAVRAAVGRLLDDGSVCILHIPFVGEVRWLAAHALAAERGAAGMTEAVRLAQAARPLEDWRLAMLAAEAFGAGAERMPLLERYARLRAANRLDVADWEVPVAPTE